MTRGIALTPRDRAIVRTAWSLGYAPAHTLRALTSPETSAGTFRDRLRKLHRAHYLTQTRFIAAAGGLWLYGIGRAALLPKDTAPWRPPLAQIQHTLAVADAVVALQRPGFAAPLTVTSWQGEAELRAWAPPGAPFPDARLTWTSARGDGAWLVEVDRATESRTAWRCKLGRYLTTAEPYLILALTTSRSRASHLAVLAADMGVPLLAATATAVSSELDPETFDARSRRIRRLSSCT